MKILSYIITISAMMILLTTSAFTFYEKGEKIDDSNFQISKIVVKMPEYHPSKTNLDKNKKNPKLGPAILNSQDLQNAFLEVAKEDKLPFEVTNQDSNNLPYLTITVANASRIGVFIDVYDQNGKWLYTYQSGNGNTNSDTIANYKMLFHKFFRAFNMELEKNKKGKK